MPNSRTHYKNRKAAEQALETFSAFKTPQTQFYFLRSLPPFVFEEMILTALKKRGHGIIRNQAYTHDGGADGCVFINDVRYLIQAKRYRKHINPADVEDFATMCKRRKARGMFVHTGKTGKKSRQLAYRHDIEIISGIKLLHLFTPPTIILLTQIANDVFRQTWIKLVYVFNKTA